MMSLFTRSYIIHVSHKIETYSFLCTDRGIKAAREAVHTIGLDSILFSEINK